MATYLHIVFKGGDSKVLDAVGDQLMRLPRSWLEALSVQNGSILFSGAMSLYGANSPTALLNRIDVFERLPFSIVDVNRSFPAQPTKRFVAIGGYGYDGTRAVLDHDNGSVLAMRRATLYFINGRTQIHGSSKS